MDLKTEIFLINVSPFNITNDKTGEVVPMTHITYALPLENDDKFEGGAVFESFTTEKMFKALHGKCFRKLNAIIQQKPIKNGMKYVFKEIDSIKCKNV